MVTLLIIVAVVVSLFAIEFAFHRRARRRIPIRIHVNGIRGKSSVVRLIAAGLRAGGVRTWAKVTGTTPNVIDELGNDIPIIRGAPSSIIEQRAVVAEAAAAGVQALVLECMALQPAFQRAEVSLLRPTIGVITNVRLDHEEVFGNSLLDIALALSNSVPRRALLVTSAGDGVPVLTAVGDRHRTEVLVIETEDFPDSITTGFSYLEHKENIGLALIVCEKAGVPRDVALAGMRTCQGDVGALRIFTLSRDGKTLRFVNALAANDPQSTTMLFDRLIAGAESTGQLILLVNTRADRPLRSRQLGRLLPTFEADHNIITGDDATSVLKQALRAGASSDRTEVVKAATEEEIVTTLFARSGGKSTIFAIGNTAGLGLPIAQYFSDHGLMDNEPLQARAEQVL
jgi:poly-gamma-glutamate synthase PgsB/CapB